MTAFRLSDPQRQQVMYWLPAMAAGGIAWLAFMALGQTPLIRASGLALVILAMGLILRPMGAALTVIGGLALAFCPAFWAQTGGAEMLEPVEVIAALGAAGVAALAIVFLSRKPQIGIAVAVMIFGGLFLLVVGSPRSLRLTTLLTAWLLYLLLDGLFAANPRPDSPPTGQLGFQHTYGLLILMIIGILNDPLFALLAPAVLLGLFLTGKRLPIRYWIVLVGISLYGFRGITALYADSNWWSYPVALAEQQNLTVPFILAGGWRDPARWLDLIQLVVYQFTLIGLALGVLGLARLARWYPPVGVVTMVAYASYALFGLVYFGADASVLLMPLLMIQVIWMTYAVYTFGQWIQKGLRQPDSSLRWLAPAGFTLLPIFMLLRIAGVV
jgi:hypothetical protein